MTNRFFLIGTIVSDVSFEKRNNQPYKSFILEEDRTYAQSKPSTYLIEFYGNLSHEVPDYDKATGTKINLFGARVVIVGHLNGQASVGEDGKMTRYVNMKGDRMQIITLGDMEPIDNPDTFGAREGIDGLPDL